MFKSSFYEYINDAKHFKLNPKDTISYSKIKVENKLQKLILDKKLTHKDGQQITGILYFTTNDYYMEDYPDEIDTVRVAGRVYFTCEIMEINY
jgi:hypothetical protein